MRICVAQMNPTIGALQQNTRAILENIEKARLQKADLVIFPEMTISGYLPQDLLLHKTFVQQIEECLQEIAQASKGISVIVGLVRPNHEKGKSLFNSAALLSNGIILDYYDKCLLPTYDVFDERRYFEPGKGVRVWEIHGKRVGILICEDIWQHAGSVDMRYHKDPVLELKALKPELIVNLSASPYHFEKPDERVAVCAKAAKTLSCPVILCCQVGGNDDLIFDGYSVSVDAQGNLTHLGKGFEEDFFAVDLEAAACPIPFKYDAIGDLYKALVLGVSDYFKKQGFQKGCLGLSGGIDSALVACIAKDALGKENVLGVSMPSKYSSEGSRSDAEHLAKNLGIKYRTLSIEEPFESYLKLLEPAFKKLPPNIAEENLQARLRGVIMMALSNKFDYIVLSTGNKSELGLGYCTLYGDMCGGLAVISDVLKTRVYELARYLNRDKEVIPWSTIEKAPSAELRPNQKDTDSLPDYAIVDQVLQGYVEDFLSAEEIAEHFQISLELVKDLISRLHRAEYKRRQAAPGIRVSKKAFSVGRRYPIVQGWIGS